MTVVGNRRRLGVAPRLLRREQAAGYMGISPGHFDRLVKEKLLPPPKKLGENIRAWDALDLDVAVDHLPYDGAAPDDGSNDLDRMLGT